MNRTVPKVSQGGNVGWFAPDYKTLVESWRTVCSILEPLKERRDNNQKRLELVTGGVLECWSLDGDPEACRGREYDDAILDESAKAKHLQLAWEQAIRATLMNRIGGAWFFTTPRGRDYQWQLWKRGQKDGQTPEELEQYKDWMSWRMPSMSNPHNSPSEIEDMRRELPATVFSQEVLAEFLDVGGRFFDEWEPVRVTRLLNEFGEWIEEREDWHVIDPFKVPQSQPFFGGLDDGKSAPFSFHLGTTDVYGDVYIVDEEYEAGLLPRAKADKVRGCLERNGVPKDQYGRFQCVIAADPSMFPPKEAEKRVGEYPIEAFWAAGLRCIPALNTRSSTNAALMEWMHSVRKVVKSDRFGYIDEDVVPRLRVFRTCVNLIRTIPLMVRDEKKPEDFDSSLEDHAVDSVRYLLGGNRPKPAKLIYPPVPRTPVHREAEHALDMNRHPGSKAFNNGTVYE